MGRKQGQGDVRGESLGERAGPNHAGPSGLREGIGFDFNCDGTGKSIVDSEKCLVLGILDSR